MGGGKGSSTTQVQMSPAQEAATAAQTKALTDTFLPAYSKTIGGAGDVYSQIAPGVKNAADTASQVAGSTSALQGAVGAGSLATGASGLASLFSPQYEQQQVQAALQPSIEAARESYQQNNAQYGGAGSLGSSRDALATANLDSLNKQRMGTVAATTQAGIEANRAAAASTLYQGGTTNLNAANQGAAARIGYAAAPQDAYSKYASVIFGVPQGNTTPNFSGTQSNTSNGKSMGFKL